MNLFQEFLAWRKDRKQREVLAQSWAAPYRDHPETEVRQCYSQYRVQNPMMMTDEQAVNAWCDYKGLYTVEQSKNT
jgi:hypothetical protein